MTGSERDTIVGIGAAITRTEDLRLLTGRGRYAGDFHPGDAAHATLVRSPHAHARIVHIDVSAAQMMPGVLAILTGADARADGLQPIPHNPDWTAPPDAILNLPEGFRVFTSSHEVLCVDTVRFVGEPVSLVVAETRAQAELAAEAVEVDYALLPAVVHAPDALGPHAPQLWPECAHNLALDCQVGDAAATEQAFATAAHIVELDTWIHRVNGTPMEPRAVLGTYDRQTARYTLRTASGRGVVQTRDRLATTLNVPASQCRAVFGDMGGNFGTRNAFYPEYALMPWAARHVGRPVTWTASRSECFLTDYQGRDLHVSAALALDADGRFLALRGTNTSNLGAYSVYFWPLRKGLSMMQGVYDISCVHFHGRAVFTNTAPTAVYRSAGRPEAIFVIERLIDIAASRHGFDRVELRQKNLIQPDAMPFTNAVGVTYDSGDYPTAMANALARLAADRGSRSTTTPGSATTRRGVAIANYIEVTSGIPRERAELHVRADGFVDLVVGTMSSGQGHETTFAQVVSDWLAIPFSRVRFHVNDTDHVSVGGGSHSGRSMRLVTIALKDAVAALLEQGRAIASEVLQAPPETVRYERGEFVVAGGGSIDLFDVAERHRARVPAAGSRASDLHGVGDITNCAGGYPYGAHACEVDVDTETGAIRVNRWIAVDDVGRAVNPLVLHGQTHGSVAQGLGQALSEAVVYEAGDAQLLTGSFMDYALPRADSPPPIEAVLMEVPATSHPHGIRPGGEGGTTPALAVVVNAVVDALSEFGVEHVEMPLTPERVLAAILAANRD